MVPATRTIAYALINNIILWKYFYPVTKMKKKKKLFILAKCPVTKKTYQL